jgi:NitT/TauT family transport system ATP-binding protein
MIELVDLDFSYPGKPVLGGLSLSVRPDEVVSILGRSGCGKTTLLRCIAGLNTPSRGTVTIDGMPPKMAAKSRKIGYMFQNDVLLTWRTVFENVALPFEIHDGADASPAAAAAIRSAVTMVGLAGEENAFPFELSGGMRQRVSMARALAPAPSILLLDEPFATLDLITREQIMFEFYEIIKKTKTSTLCVTHHVEEAVFLSDRILILSGRPATITDEKAVQFNEQRTKELLTRTEFITLVDEIKRMVRTQDAGSP